MHTIDLLEEALWIANQSGWQVRHEWLAGSAGGACRLGKSHILFVDRSLTATEQLEQVIDGLRSQLHRVKDPFTTSFATCLKEFVISNELKRALGCSILVP